MNTLHRHFASNKNWTEWGFEWPPHLEATRRLGSNCAGATLSEQHDFYVGQYNATWEVSTEHSRNGDGLNGVPNIAKEIFKAMMGHPEWWSFAGVYFDGFASEMGEVDRSRLMSYADTNALTMMDYGDERLLANWNLIEGIQFLRPEQQYLIGLELNILPDGELDTNLGNDPRCKLRIGSLHPHNEPVGFAQHRQDPVYYSQFLAAVMNRLDLDILAHPGYNCKANLPGSDSETEFRNAMEWDELLEVLWTRDIALEINWSRVYQAGCNKQDGWPEEKWREEARTLFEQTPFLNDDRVMAKLAPWIKRGLLITINNDGHYVPKSPTAKGRFDEYIGMFCEWVDERMIRYNICPDQVVNTWTRTEVEDWLSSRRAA